MLDSAGSITAHSLAQADKSKRRSIARDCWLFCNKEAQELLLNDECSLVRTEAIYARRDWQVTTLKRKGTVTAEDLSELDRLGRFAVGDQLWNECTEEARAQLLNDIHPQVRACAVIAHRRVTITVPSFGA